jgi:hypothetical protein
MSRLDNFKKMQQELKTDIHAKLLSIIHQLIPNSVIYVNVSDDIEVFTFEILMENKISKTTVTITENILVYDINDPENLVFKGSGKIAIYKPKDNSEAFNSVNLYSLASTNAEIDLRTLFSLKNRLKDFAEKENLLPDSWIEREEDPGVASSITKEINEEA